MKKYQNRLYLDIFCAFWGENFSPKKLQTLTDLVLRDTNEVGDPDPIVEICDFGAASMYPPAEYDDSESDVLNWFLEKLEEHYATICECGVEEIDLWIMYPLEGQKSWSFSREQIQKMGKMGICVCFSATERENEPLQDEVKAMYVES